MEVDEDDLEVDEDDVEVDEDDLKVDEDEVEVDEDGNWNLGLAHLEVGKVEMERGVQ